MPILSEAATDAATATTTTTPAADIPTNPDGRPHGPHPDRITSTLTTTRTKQPRDNVDSGQPRYRGPNASPKTRSSRNLEASPLSDDNVGSGQRRCVG